MITFREYLLESKIHSLSEVASKYDLLDEVTGEYLTGEVNVQDYVSLNAEEHADKLSKLPVKFGKVGGYFSCSFNKLTSLEGAPSSVGDYFVCSNNRLTSLEGAPREVHGYFSCAKNKITSLEGIHKIFKIISGGFYCVGNPITSGGIGLILIEGLKGIHTDHHAFTIIRKYLGQGKKGLLLCQDELVEAGYEEYAKL
jgi:hypothetical protein